MHSMEIRSRPKTGRSPNVKWWGFQLKVLTKDPSLFFPLLQILIMLTVGPHGPNLMMRALIIMCGQSLRPVQLFVTPWTVAGQTPLSMAFSRQEDWSGLPFPTPRDIPNPGLEPTSTDSPVLASGFFTTSVTWEASINNNDNNNNYGDVVQWLSHVQLFVTLRTAAYQASLSLTISQTLPKFVSIESAMPSKHLILCHPLLLCFHSFPASGLFHGNGNLSEFLCANHSKPLPYFFVAVVHSLSHVRLFAPPWAQHARLPCPPPPPRVCSNSRALSRGCYLAIILCRPLLLLPSVFLLFKCSCQSIT